mmetsp:Transcript_45249/g.109073  ORF Transcript_45249/g.109073 Transcript_45249/m.109073 type:complete len:99 (+) Transcript_45249:247-543(+)
MPATREKKYEAPMIRFGRPDRSDLKECVGLDNDHELGVLLKNPLKAMKKEWYAHGSPSDVENFEYVVNGFVAPERFPNHVKESLKTGFYHPQEENHVC